MKRYYYNLSLLLDEVLSEHAERPALRYANKEYRYSDIARQVDQLVILLLSLKLTKGQTIVIGHTKRPLSYALMIAALRLGIAYVIIDVTAPIERTQHILNICNANIIFFDDIRWEMKMRELASVHACHRTIYLDENMIPDVSVSERKYQIDIAKHVDGSCIAYIMFTSGSTGKPKGVAITHQNILHFIAWGQERFNLTNQDNFANLSPMYFDNSVFDFYVGMFSGACLTPIERELLIQPYELINYISKVGCTIWFSVPSLLIYLMTMKALREDSMSALRLIIFGGEGYPKVELKKLYDLFRHRVTLVNVYGPTECTCICSSHEIKDTDFIDIQGLPTLGKLNQNFSYRILDEDGCDAEIGQLCLIGPNVGAGYFNDIDRTNASFVSLVDPLNYMKRMYCTGDLVRKKDEFFYFIGRKDNQIKHMGYRIEIEEIEQALIRLPKVNQAAAIYYRTHTAYGKLIGFVASIEEDIKEKNLLTELAKFLPEYMLPSRILIFSTLPKNPNGKIDRQRLHDIFKKIHMNNNTSYAVGLPIR